MTERSSPSTSGRPEPQSPDKVAFARRLRAAIERKGWTLSETARQTSDVLGADAKFGRAHVWHYLNARAIPRARHLDALSQALQIPPHELLGSAPPPPQERGPEPVADATPAPAQPTLEPLVSATPVVHAEDYGDGTAFLRVSQRVSWPTALKVMTLLKAPFQDEK